MQISHILSDLTSLRVCDPTAALALVQARTPSSQASTSPSSPSIQRSPSSSKPTPTEQANDPDMQRATDLMELHQGVKLKHARGLNKGLVQARADVEKVLSGLEAGGER